MTTPYSAREIVPDGQLSGPRWLLHVVKVAQHVASAFALVCLSSALLGVPNFFLSSLVAGALVYFSILIRKRIKRAPVNRADWIFDSSFGWLTVGGGLLAERDFLLAAPILLLAFVLYVGLRHKGNP